MINVYNDSFSLLSTIGTLVESIEDYVKIYQEILYSLQTNQDNIFVVRNHVIIQWLNNMSRRYPQENFKFVSIDPRSALSRHWCVEIPTQVTNEEILQAGLLSIDIRPNPGFNFQDTLLSHFFSTILISKTFPFTQLILLLNTENLKQWKAKCIIPLLARTLSQRFEEWKNIAHSSEQREFIDLFINDPFKLKQQLVCFRVLRSYPAIGDAILGSNNALFSSLKLTLEDLTIEESLIPDVLLQVTYHLNDQQLQSAEDMEALIENVSGLLSVEFDFIEKNLIAHPQWLSPNLMDQLERKFESLSRRYKRRITILRSQIRPSKPEYPEMNWNLDSMLEWATQCYLPYYSWCNLRQEFDTELYSIGDRFAEWLISCWSDLHANSGRMVFNILPNKAAALKQAGGVNLILVVDNLGWAFTDTVRNLFEDRGFFLTSAEPYLAMLPTETEISKKCLLAGTVGYNAIDDKTYKGMIEKGWVPYFNDRAFRYISDIGSLGKIEVIEASTYVVNYLAVDKALHKSADEIGMPHREHVNHLLSHLVENVIAFIERHSLQDKIHIHVVSDHGSTCIPAWIQNDLDPVFYKGNGFNAWSHRYIEVSEERFARLADNLKLDCFFLPAHDYLNPTNVLCARRANRFIPTDQDIYVHGGLLPEEVIVPYMSFEPVTVPIQDLTVLLKKHEYRYRVETIELEVGNPNDAAVEQIQLSVLNSNIESEPVSIPVLNGKNKTSVQVKARFKLTTLPEEQTSMRIRLRFRARGETHTVDVQPSIVMRKIVEEKSSSLFDD